MFFGALSRAITIDNNGTPGAPRAVLASTFDTAGNRLSVQVGGPDPIGGAALPGIVDFKNVYVVDAASRVTRIDQVQQTGATVDDKRVDLAYNVLGQFQTIVRRNSVAGSGNEVATSQYGFDQLGRGKSLAHTGPGSLSIAYAMSYDQLNRVIQFVGPDGTRDYGYDETNQLKTADYSGTSGIEETYNFDQSGNRTGTNNNGAGDKTYTAGTNNRLVRDGTYEYTYDAEGNRIRRVTLVGGNPTGATTDYDHDHRNRMFRVTQRATPGGPAIHIVEYVYDAFDRRIAKKIDAAPDGFFEDEERFLYDGSAIIVSFNSVNAVEHRYLHGPAVDQVFADEQLLSGEGTLWSLPDLQGTIRDLANNAAQIKNHLKYDSFGRTTDETNAAIDFVFGYTGRERDEETGLMYYRSRYYDPVVGRFIEEDGAGFGAGDYNLARYIGNGPTNGTDPSGMFDHELFWENVQIMDSELARWFEGVHGKVRQGNYLSNASGEWEDVYNTGLEEVPIVYLEEDYNEYEAAVAFIDTVVNDDVIGKHYRVLPIAQGSPEAMDEFGDLWMCRAAESVRLGGNVYLAFISIVNEGADWVITTGELFEGNWWAVIGYLPLISGGTVKAINHAGITTTLTEAELRWFRKAGVNKANFDLLIGGAHSGLWQALDEVVDPSVVKQLHPDSCGPASASMLLCGQGIEVTEAAVIAAKGGVHASDIEELTRVMNQLSKSDMWMGHRMTPSRKNFDGLIKKGSFGTTFKTFHMPMEHMVVVDGVDNIGRVIIRDPGSGTKYFMEWAEFSRVWSGATVYRK